MSGGWWSQADGVIRLVAVLLLVMSIASWVVILWKSRQLARAGGALRRATAAFWQAPSPAAGRDAANAFDREGLLAPLTGVLTEAPALRSVGAGTSAGDRATRLVRDALHRSLERLGFGQTLLATVGSIAPFVGLLGTVWGIYRALAGIATAGQITIDKVAGPVGEALVMTAAGLAVAIPAVLAYNVFGRIAARIEADLEGFAHDLRGLMLDDRPPVSRETVRERDDAVA